MEPVLGSHFDCAEQGAWTNSPEFDKIAWSDFGRAQRARRASVRMARVNLTLSAIANMRARTFTSHSLCVRGTLDRLIEAHSTVRAEVNLRPRLGVDKRVYERAKAGVATRASDSREYPVEDSNRWKRPGQNPCHTPPLSQVGKYDHRQRYEGNPGEQKRTDEPCPASQIFPDRHDSPYGLVEAHAAVGAVIESRIPPEDRSSLGTQPKKIGIAKRQE